MSVPTGSVDILKLDLYRILGVQEDATEKEVRIHKMRFINARNFNLTIMYGVATCHDTLCIILCGIFYFIHSASLTYAL